MYVPTAKEQPIIPLPFSWTWLDQKQLQFLLTTMSGDNSSELLVILILCIVSSPHFKPEDCGIGYASNITTYEGHDLSFFDCNLWDPETFSISNFNYTYITLAKRG